MLEALDIAVAPGEFIGIIGPNAAGKSTLARLLMGVLRPSSGRVLLDGNPVLEFGPAELARNLGLVFQDPESQSVASTVEEEVAFGPENLAIASAEIRERVDWALEQVGLVGLHSREVHHLSGGQKQRLALASLLASRPRYLILDEPTAMLDPSARQQLLSILLELRRENQMGAIFITHRLEELMSATRIYLLHGGQLELLGDFQGLVQHADRLERLGVRLPAQVALRRLCKGEWPHEEAEVGQMLSEKWTAWRGLTALERHGEPAPSLLTLEGCWERAQAGKVCLQDISCLLTQHGRLGLLGRTGSGKSTLLAHLVGLSVFSSGNYRFLERSIDGRFSQWRWLRKEIALLFQNPEHFFFHDKVVDELDFVRNNFGLSRVVKVYQNLMEQVGLSPELLSSNPFELSGGQQRLVALATALAAEPELLLLDEPTAGLDGFHGQLVLRNIVSFAGSALVVSHELDDLSELCQQVLLLDSGRLVEQGSLRSEPERWQKLGLHLPWLAQTLASWTPAGALCPFTVEQLIDAPL